MNLDWDRLSDQDFEELCYEILEKEGYHNVNWLGRSGGDRGRDVICKRDFFFDSVKIKREFTVIAQCKKFLARPPSASDLENAIAWANYHKPDVLIIMISNILSPGTHDWIESREEDTKYKIIIFDNKNFETFFEAHDDVYKGFFESDGGYYHKKIEELKIHVLNCLLDNKSKTALEISNVLNVLIEDIDVTIEELIEEKLLSYYEESEKKYHLNENMESFMYISKYLLSSNFKFTYLLSQYATDNINMDLVNYIKERFYLDLDKKEKIQLHVLLSVSPSSLYDALFLNTDLYKNAYDHIQKLSLPQDEVLKWNNSIINRFFMLLIQKTLIDLQNPESSTILKEKEIKGLKILIDLNMASKEQLIFGMKSESVIMLHKSAGPIKAGQLVSATDPDLFIDSGTTLMNLGMLEFAINDFDKAIEQVKEKEKLKVAWNNKGVSLMRLKKWDDAITCFDKALKIDPDLEEAINNKQKCRIQSTK